MISLYLCRLFLENSCQNSLSKIFLHLQEKGGLCIDSLPPQTYFEWKGNFLTLFNIKCQVQKWSLEWIFSWKVISLQSFKLMGIFSFFYRTSELWRLFHRTKFSKVLNSADNSQNCGDLNHCFSSLKLFKPLIDKTINFLTQIVKK